MLTEMAFLFEDAPCLAAKRMVFKGTRKDIFLTLFNISSFS